MPDEKYTADLHLSIPERIELAISRLSILQAAEVSLEDACPICLSSFGSVPDGNAAEDSDAATPDADEVAVVTRLEGCGHVFCRPCMIEWIRSLHGSCPSCRKLFSSLEPPTDQTDNESSDGDYVPGDDEDEEDEDDDIFFDDEDDEDDDIDMDIDEPFFMLGDVAPNELVVVGAWESESDDEDMDNWGLSDGEGSESVSEVEILALSTELLQEDDAAGVYSDSAEASGTPDDEPK
ncbi:hypothetical protein BC628DRAFT_1495936 [Trametes gibbosa]|uniref:RING-type domain-containing protein n=1 Tax=Trametes gibbosa TaxID=160864 RepID=A0A6G6FQM9_9APHY|nr:hypothetical protein BC628DRAFT_1495936 [Trametes gibbosa]QIE48554.1 hypothetical protein [Trametes gibbosa]